MDARSAAKVLEGALAGHRGDLTIADASAKSGLPLRDAERGLHALVSEYRGHLRVTSEGELLFRFPNGFTKPWETRTKIQNALRKAGKTLVGVGRFVVRAWIAIVLIAYVAIFVALMIAMMFAQSNDNRRSRSSFGDGLAFVFLRIVGDALFWTFHPFSPFAYGYYGGYGARTWDGRRAPARRKDETPFYEKVNRFFFGPTVPDPDPHATERAIVAQIRAQKGRIGLSDVMRVTGLPRDEADPLMARLMLDYDGTVEVTDAGAIVYRFEALRKTAANEPVPPKPSPVWAHLEKLGPLTGNTPGANFLIVALNGFNLVMSMYALSASLTIERVTALVQGVPPWQIPPPSTAVALGVVPFVFSIALFTLPLGRAVYRRVKARRLARENGRRALLREILDKAATSAIITDDSLERAFRGASGLEPDPKRITREVVALGGDVDVTDDGRVRYRFPELEAEAHALEAERDAASEEEARVGRVIFASDE
jgi:hypothetical protein